MKMNQHDYDEIIHDDDLDECEDVELVGGSGRQRRAPPTSAPSRSLAGGGTVSSSSTTKRMSIFILFLVALVGVYQLGMKTGKGESKAAEDTELKAEGEPHNTDEETPTTTTKHGPSFTLERVQSTRHAAQTLIHSLQEYWGGQEQCEKMMLKSWLRGWNFDVRDSMVTKLVDTMTRALVTDDQHEFIIGTIGSSVAAGHDNCNYDSYEKQMCRTFGPVWEAAGMTLVCQNAGEGGGCGDSHENQVWCIKQNVSPNIDIAHYSWTYFEHPQERALEFRESLSRWTQMMPRQPPVHVFNTGGLPGHPNGEYELAEHMSEFGYNAFYMNTGYRNGAYDYESAKENGVDHFGWGHIGDGYHNVTRYGENEEGERRESLGVVMRNWHPGPLAFQFVSDTFSYVYSKAVLNALEIIENDLKKGIDPAEKWDASKRMILLKSSLPEPIFCDPLYCVVDEAPGCTNYEQPTYGWWGAKVEDPNDDLNPHKGEAQNWQIWLDGQEKDPWHMVPKQDQVFFENLGDTETCKHFDACGGISATSKDNGSLVLRLPKQEVGLLILCGCCGKDVGMDMFLNNTNLEFSYNGQVLDDRSEWDIYPNGKCVRLMKAFDANAAPATTGHNYLKIKALENLADPVRISHIITL